MAGIGSQWLVVCRLPLQGMVAQHLSHGDSLFTSRLDAGGHNIELIATNHESGGSMCGSGGAGHCDSLRLLSFLLEHIKSVGENIAHFVVVVSSSKTSTQFCLSKRGVLCSMCKYVRTHEHGLDGALQFC